MSATTKIEWCDATFNPWSGCTKWGPDCDNCYAASFSLRVGGPEYLKGVPRRRCSGFEKSALALARKAEKAGTRLKVFPSLCDIFDAEVPPEWRADFWRVVDATRDRLDWLILTKRTANIAGMLPDGWGDGWEGVWLGMSAGDQRTFDRRVDDFFKVRAAVCFLSYEPAFGGLSLEGRMHSHCEVAYCLGGSGEPMHEPTTHRRFDWVIVGGESGPGARPFHTGWARSIIAQCAESKTACFVKQLGALPVGPSECYGCEGEQFEGHVCDRCGDTVEIVGDDRVMHLRSKKGNDPAEWPADLRVRQWPAQVPRVERVGRGAYRATPHAGSE